MQTTVRRLSGRHGLFCGHCGGRMFSELDQENGVFVRQLTCLACGRSADPASALPLVRIDSMLAQ